MLRSTERTRTTHCGTLPRPPHVLDLVAAVADGSGSEDEAFESTIREAVDTVVARQVAAGITIVNDGEQGKFHFGTYFQQRLSGFTLRAPAARRAGGEVARYGEYF